MQKIKKCGCAGCSQPAKIELSLNWGKGGNLAVCAEHLPNWVKGTPKVGDSSPPANLPFYKGSAYTITQVF
jgi:hypothetical protein